MNKTDVSHGEIKNPSQPEHRRKQPPKAVRTKKGRSDRPRSDEKFSGARVFYESKTRRYQRGTEPQ
jgi:hypothetical protein